MEEWVNCINWNKLWIRIEGGYLHMEDLAEISMYYEIFSTAQYLYENQTEDKPLTRREAYFMAIFIREKINDVCTCESDMINEWYDEAYADAKDSPYYELTEDDDGYGYERF